MDNMPRTNLLLIFWSLLFVTCVLPMNAQEPITLENIWSSNRLHPKGAGSFNFLNDGRHFTRLYQNSIQRYDLLSGKALDILYTGGDSLRIQKYTFSSDERHLLIQWDRESIYRHSYLTRCIVWDRKSERSYPVGRGEKIMYPTLSPDGRNVAYVRDNDLYYQDLISGLETQVTNDGEKNAIINGASDWVYEEEFALIRSFEWSPDGTRLAFYRFDESQVPEFTMDLYMDEAYPRKTTFKYPKVGEVNATVSVRIYDLATGATLNLDTGPEPDQYIPRIYWTTDPTQLGVFRMNRHQNNLEVLLFHVQTGQPKSLLVESSKTYLDIHDNLRFLKDGKHFLWTSEMDGFNHIYLYNMAGKLVRQLTSGPWEVTDFYGVDEAKGLVYFQAARTSPMKREVYEVPLKGGTIRPILDRDGVNSAQFSTTYDYLVATHTTINTPSVYEVFDRKGEVIRILEDNQEVVAAQKRHGVQPVSYFSFTTTDQVQLNGWMIKPANFNPSKTYPVFMFLYGGPGSQQVIDTWKGSNYWWFQMLASQGFLVACVDNRGTGGRGADFKKITYLQLGHYETLDQIEAARYLGGLPYVDASRIGIFGWSYGGYMSSLCLLKGNDVFKAAIAVAPVTNWKWYDTIYTERFMRTETENPEGYRQNSPVYFADRLKGKYLLIHGMADDNVHFQNAAEMSNALIKANKPFEMAYYPNSNHGIGGGNNKLHLYAKMTAFIQSHLGSGTEP